MMPLTHHDVVRHAAPLVHAGLSIDLARTERGRRRILFQPQSADEGSLRLLHSLTVLSNGDVELVRAVAHCQSTLVSTLIAAGADAGALIDVFKQVPVARQITCTDGHVIAESWTLEPARGQRSPDARLTLQHIAGRVGPLMLMADISSGAGMQATAYLDSVTDWTDHLREHLASGAITPHRHETALMLLAALGANSTRPDDATDHAKRCLLKALPDDVLATLGPHWRPMVWQGTYWKSALRQLGREPGRSELASARLRRALDHLGQVISNPPARYHADHAAARRSVYFRRLRPLMVLLAILAVMPITWFFVERGGVQMHPLALGLTPLLMVGVVMMSAQEIPVMEIPPLPRPLSGSRWTPWKSRAEHGDGADTDAPQHHA